MIVPEYLKDVLAKAMHEKSLHDPNIKIKNLYVNGCKGCGECCSRYLPLSKTDIKRIQAFVKARNIDQIPERADLDLMCPYLKDDKTCAIYEVRPDICRAYRCDFHANGMIDAIVLSIRKDSYKEMDMRKVIV